MNQFFLEGKDYIELHNLLKVTGLCGSGGEAKMLITESRIKVDGAVELRKRCKIRPGQVVEFQGQRIEVRA